MVTSAHPGHTLGPFSPREKDRMRAFVALLALTPALSRREREKRGTHYLAAGSVV